MAEKELRGESPSATLTNGKDVRSMSAIEKAEALEAQNAIDPVLDKKVTRKCDLHIIPWLFGIWYVYRNHNQLGH